MDPVHPYDYWFEDKEQPFPAEEIHDPPKPVKGLWLGVCVYCGGSLGGPYQEDLYHMECDKKAETSYFHSVLDAAGV